MGDDIKIADLLSGDGTDTLTFGYTVRRYDYDDDGVSILDGDSNSGFYFNQATGDTASGQNFRGVQFRSIACTTAWTTRTAKRSTSAGSEAAHAASTQQAAPDYLANCRDNSSDRSNSF